MLRPIENVKLSHMNDGRKAPEYPPETTGMRWLPLAEVERLIGKRERNARYWLERHRIPAHGDRPRLFSEEAILAKLTELGQRHRKPPEYPPESAGTSSELIEAAYRVAGEPAAAVALVPLAAMVDQVRGLTDRLAELARRNEDLALEVGTLRERQVWHEGQLKEKDQTIVTQADQLAELTRRAQEVEAAAPVPHQEEETTPERIAAAAFVRRVDAYLARQAENDAKVGIRRSGAKMASHWWATAERLATQPADPPPPPSTRGERLRAWLRGE